MASLTLGNKPQVCIALFRQVYLADIDPGSAVDRTGLYAAAALVQQELQLNSPALQKLCHGQGSGVEGLLILAEGQVHVPLRAAAPAQKIFRSLQHAEDLALDVQCSPAPDIALGYLSGKRRISPVLLGAGFHAHHIHVGHKQYRLQVFIPALYMYEQTAAHSLGDGRGRDCRVRVANQLPELCELFVAALSPVYRAAGNGGGEVPEGPFPVQLRIVFLIPVKSLIVGHLSSR